MFAFIIAALLAEFALYLTRYPLFVAITPCFYLIERLPQSGKKGHPGRKPLTPTADDQIAEMCGPGNKKNERSREGAKGKMIATKRQQ